MFYVFTRDDKDMNKHETSDMEKKGKNRLLCKSMMFAIIFEFRILFLSCFIFLYENNKKTDYFFKYIFSEFLETKCSKVNL